MTSEDPMIFRMDLAKMVGDKLSTYLRSVIESDSLRKSMRVEIDVEGELVLARIVFPQYWAVYYHDGRGPVRPTNGKFIVFFQDVEDDPRVSGGYPERVGDIKRLNLSPAEFKALVKSGELIVRKAVGPAKSHRFLDKLRGNSSAKVATLVKNEFSKHVQASLKDLLDIRISHTLD